MDCIYNADGVYYKSTDIIVSIENNKNDSQYIEIKNKLIQYDFDNIEELKTLLLY